MPGRPTQDPRRSGDCRSRNHNRLVDNLHRLIGRLLELFGTMPSPTVLLKHANLPTRTRQILFVVLFLFVLSAAIASWGNVRGIFQSVSVVFLIILAVYALDRMFRSTEPYWKIAARVASSASVLILFLITYEPHVPGSAPARGPNSGH